MTSATDTPFRNEVAPLNWDSETFGLQIGRIEQSDLTDRELHRILQLARADRYRLVYWLANAEQRPSPELLREFNGTLIDKRVTFEKELRETDSKEWESTGSNRIQIAEHSHAEPNDELIELAIAAGAHSRFRRDHQIPNAGFRSMYRTWIRRSTLRELADIVLIATEPDGTLAGFITATYSHNAIASIGLIAVASESRGQGVGSALIEAVHRSMRANNARTSRVVTQLDNIPACKLYEKHGYRIQRIEHTYHFWL